MVESPLRLVGRDVIVKSMQISSLAYSKTFFQSSSLCNILMICEPIFEVWHVASHSLNHRKLWPIQREYRKRISFILFDKSESWNLNEQIYAWLTDFDWLADHGARKELSIRCTSVNASRYDFDADSAGWSCFARRSFAVSYRLKFVWMEACTSLNKSASSTSVKRRGQVCDRSLNRHASDLGVRIRSAVASCITSRESNSLMTMLTSSRQMIYYISLLTVSDFAS